MKLVETTLERRYRPLLYGLVTIVGVWLVAWAGYRWLRSAEVTAETIGAYLRTTDLRGLKADAREEALRRLAAQLNSLSYEERRKARLNREWQAWFEAMTEEEKSSFIESTMPTGVKQMLGAFEQLPPDKRQRAIDDAIRRMRLARAEVNDESPSLGTNPPIALSEEVQRKMTATGLRTFYRESSAQTKAELAPFLEELQKTMEGGRLFRRQQME